MARGTLKPIDTAPQNTIETTHRDWKVHTMSEAADKILEQLQAQNDLRMEAAKDIAQAVAARVEAEHKVDEAKATEKQAFAVALKKGWTQAELNKIGSPSRRRPRKKTSESGTSDES